MAGLRFEGQPRVLETPGKAIEIKRRFVAGVLAGAMVFAGAAACALDSGAGSQQIAPDFGNSQQINPDVNKVVVNRLSVFPVTADNEELQNVLDSKNKAGNARWNELTEWVENWKTDPVNEFPEGTKFAFSVNVSYSGITKTEEQAQNEVTRLAEIAEGKFKEIDVLPVSEANMPEGEYSPVQASPSNGSFDGYTLIFYAYTESPQSSVS